jgi:5-methyltetrahydropteroyltriglutamate--homocysteine methyltransferase
MRQIVETLLPTTMVGSYPRPAWFTYQLLGRDIRVAFKQVAHAEAFADATRVVMQDQEAAGLDIVTDGQMYFDDYVGSCTCCVRINPPGSPVDRHRGKKA